MDSAIKEIEVKNIVPFLKVDYHHNDKLSFPIYVTLLTNSELWNNKDYLRTMFLSKDLTYKWAVRRLKPVNLSRQIKNFIKNLLSYKGWSEEKTSNFVEWLSSGWVLVIFPKDVLKKEEDKFWIAEFRGVYKEKYIPFLINEIILNDKLSEFIRQNLERILKENIKIDYHLTYKLKDKAVAYLK